VARHSNAAAGIPQHFVYDRSEFFYSTPVWQDSGVIFVPGGSSICGYHRGARERK
jgi:hypothetical protein